MEWVITVSVLGEKEPIVLSPVVSVFWIIVVRLFLVNSRTLKILN